jgi:multicomponent K+:H+ antiporter subunit G
MHPLAEALIAGLILIGAFFLFVGSFGLAKLPDLMRRLHGPTKATTLGIGSLLIASMLYFPFAGAKFSIHELMITVFLFLTAPVSAHMIAKAHLLRSKRERSALSATGRSVGWATLDDGSSVSSSSRPR